MVIILFFLVAFASVNAAIFTPALPTIQATFHVSIEAVQLMVTVYLVGYALGQLPYGPLADGIGRKKTLYLGLFIAACGAALSIVSSAIHCFALLVISQFIQALGGCVGMKISFTMIADLYSHEKATKMLGKILIAFAILPGLAIAFGGFLTDTLGWVSCYYFILLLALVMIGCTAFLPETATSIDKKALQIEAIAKGFIAQFQNRKVVLSGITLGCMSAVIYIFQTKAPFIGIQLLGMTPQSFGTYSIIPRFGMLIGCVLAALLAGKFLIKTLSQIGAFIPVVFGLAQLLWFFILPLNTFALFILTGLIYSFQSMAYTNVTSFALTHAHNKANASALLNFLNIGIAVISLLLFGVLYPQSPLMLPIALCVFLLLSFWLVLWLFKECTSQSNSKKK